MPLAPHALLLQQCFCVNWLVLSVRRFPLYVARGAAAGLRIFRACGTCTHYREALADLLSAASAGGATEAPGGSRSGSSSSSDDEGGGGGGQNLLGISGYSTHAAAAAGNNGGKAAASAAPATAGRLYQTGELVWYKERSGQLVAAVVTAVDSSLLPHAYQVDIAGAVRDTEGLRLLPRRQGTASLPLRQACFAMFL